MRAAAMGRLHSINGEAVSGSTRENLIDSFGYMPSIGAHSALSPGHRIGSGSNGGG